MGVWIETTKRMRVVKTHDTSLPMWECGLKQTYAFGLKRSFVTPHVGVWIETNVNYLISHIDNVTPHVGVWIETFFKRIVLCRCCVTPHVGVWIETKMESE